MEKEDSSFSKSRDMLDRTGNDMCKGHVEAVASGPEIPFLSTIKSYDYQSKVTMNFVFFLR